MIKFYFTSNTFGTQQATLLNQNIITVLSFLLTTKHDAYCHFVSKKMGKCDGDNDSGLGTLVYFDGR